MNILMKELMSDPGLKSIAWEVSAYVAKLIGDIKKLNDVDRNRYMVGIDESGYLTDSIEYIQDIFLCEVKIQNAGDKDVHDPSNKARHAVPLRPAIYVE
jgi:leucyl-tRNA synthetase